MNLQLTILSKLRNVNPRLLPIETLWQQTRMSLVPQPSRPDFNEALRVLENEKKQILVLHNEDRGDRAKITDEGIARHEEANS